MTDTEKPERRRFQIIAKQAAVRAAVAAVKGKP